MIRTFGDKDTERLFWYRSAKRLPPTIQRPALRKLLVLHAAASLGDLGVLPGNRLEKLHGDREGQFSLRINQQWRICFRWDAGEAYDVEITDYH